MPGAMIYPSSKSHDSRPFVVDCHVIVCCHRATGKSGL
ncbi:hypothetical protein RSAG8_08780, partial [Rhizoctonia solani AG-8 WAC10335]